MDLSCHRQIVDNDSYGVLLEDDVGLSPLFYAWINWYASAPSLDSDIPLTTRIDTRSIDCIPDMYGISLTTSKNTSNASIWPTSVRLSTLGGKELVATCKFWFI